MISFRTHVVTLVAVLLTLAVGIALGGGPLSEVGRRALTPAPAGEVSRENAAAASYADIFATTAATTLYADGLETRPVAVVTMPGADEDVVIALAAEIEAAGGTVPATYDVQPALLDPSEKSLVDTLGSQLITQLGAGQVEETAPTYDRIGQLLGLAVASTSTTGSVPDQKASSVLQSLVGADLLVAPDGGSRRAPLVLVVLGSDVHDDILAGVLAGLAVRSVGVVAVGDSDTPDLAGLRAAPVSDEVATVDGVERDLGRVTATLALIRSLETRGGAFGASGADGAVPLG